ncbi:glycosyltransferase family 4 protein [Patescibacteria group bacterium]|nr:glycosyltransferase family 4 protein [Patescibacteria group bacterium]
MNHLYGLDYEFVGLELNSKMYMKGSSLFRNFAPEVFDHHIINIHHLPIMNIIKKARSIRDVENAYREPLKIIRNILREIKPDVLLLSGTYYVPWLISIAAKREHIPIVLWYSGVLSRETETAPAHIRRICSLMEKSIMSRADRTIFPSRLCKDVVEKEVTKRKIKNGYVIPNPVASIFTDPCAIEYSLERRIAAVGRYSKVKNFDLFFALHKELLRRRWQHTACFITNPDARFKKIPKAIEILPPMTTEGLKKFYISQGLIVCPSTFETFGNVPMEAACLGVPVLVSDKMGCAEILNKVGLENMIISFDDMGKVADRVQQLCGQSILPRQLHALKRILDNRLISEEINAVLIDATKKSTL